MKFYKYIILLNRNTAHVQKQYIWCNHGTGKSFCLCICVGKKQDLWYVVDLLTGEKQQTLTSSFAEMLCPSSSLLYLGRTGKNKNKPATQVQLSELTFVSYLCRLNLVRLYVCISAHPIQLLI